MGPGLLAAGAAIGVSHLVQSTRAGAEFGYQLLWVVLLANLVKYPFFELAPRYTAQTKKSLIEGYRQMGVVPVWVVLLMTIATMFIIQAAVTIVTAGLVVEVFKVDIHPKWVSLFLLMFSMALLISGKYRFLDQLIKVIIIVLSVTTLFSLFGALNLDKENVLPVNESIFSWQNKSHIFFLIALAGWMPAPLDLSVWHSLWIKEKMKIEKKQSSLKSLILDFRISYIGTVVLAVGFLALGAMVMHGTQEAFPASAGGFAAKLIGLYTTSLGSGAYLIISIAALSTMFSTTLTCFDAFPRVLQDSMAELGCFKKRDSKLVYSACLVIVMSGAMILLFGFIENMKEMVGLATTVSFVLTPFYAFLNHKLAMSTPEITLTKFRIWIHRIFIVALVSFSGWFLWVKYVST